MFHQSDSCCRDKLCCVRGPSPRSAHCFRLTTEKRCYNCSALSNTRHHAPDSRPSEGAPPAWPRPPPRACLSGAWTSSARTRGARARTRPEHVTRARYRMQIEDSHYEHDYLRSDTVRALSDRMAMKCQLVVIFDKDIKRSVLAYN